MDEFQARPVERLARCSALCRSTARPRSTCRGPSVCARMGGTLVIAQLERSAPVSGRGSGVPMRTHSSTTQGSTSEVATAAGAESPTASPRDGTRPVAHAAASRTHVPSTRASRAWLKVLPALALLAIILLFVFQNLGSTKVSFVTASGRLPLALALLAAAALGALLVLALGSIRIAQLRKVIRRSRVRASHN